MWRRRGPTLPTRFEAAVWLRPCRNSLLLLLGEKSACEQAVQPLMLPVDVHRERYTIPPVHSCSRTLRRVLCTCPPSKKSSIRANLSCESNRATSIDALRSGAPGVEGRRRDRWDGFQEK